MKKFTILGLVFGLLFVSAVFAASFGTGTSTANTKVLIKDTSLGKYAIAGNGLALYGTGFTSTGNDISVTYTRADKKSFTEVFTGMNASSTSSNASSTSSNASSTSSNASSVSGAIYFTVPKSLSVKDDFGDTVTHIINKGDLLKLVVSNKNGKSNAFEVKVK